ncbi:hypothetical protein FisN_6Lh197 [Fistulifera solaris]|uniref:BTB domain-containing protein n=1 Tax=Fistulifera solaris TaxID=1519565 RepID=A0A1Z5J602_FISSO|nr:hypothetical protein FisN_6Lh197 [Fistulifera solaris]|eukprot:GAX09427.1 hypothetical protein FisN_6Lh197 [Fistulifera solaris]
MMRLTHERLHRHRQLRRRRQESSAECSPTAEDPGNRTQGTASLSSSSSVKMGDDYSLDISEASSIEHVSTSSVFVSPVDQPPSDEEDEEPQPTSHSLATKLSFDSDHSRAPSTIKAYHRKQDDDVASALAVHSQMSYAEWKKQHLTDQPSSSLVSSPSGSAIARIRSTAPPQQRLTAISTAIEDSPYTDTRYFRNQQSGYSDPDRLPIVTPPRSVVSQTSSPGRTGQVLNTSYGSNGSNDDVVVRVGGNDFWHSRAILCYASKVLAHHLATRDELHIPHKSPSEWNELQVFLQPRSVQSASITFRNLPALLPWFDQLELTVLLRECDILLSKLRFATVTTDESSSSQNGVSNAVHELARVALGLPHAPPRMEPPCPLDVLDILLLTRISGKVCLPRTRVMCLNVLQEYLERPFLFVSFEECAMRSITSLIDLLDDEEVLDTVWPLIVSYLPEDLPWLDDRHKLLNNPLFSYLLRSGLEKAWRDSDDELGTLLMGNGRSREISKVTSKCAFEADSSVEVSFVSEHHADDAGGKVYHSSYEEDGLDPIESLEYTFESWKEESPAQTSNVRSSSVSTNRNHRSLWLNAIWHKLQDPPIFSTDIPVETASRLSEIRTFSC